MNIVAYEENERNRGYITTHLFKRGKHPLKVLEVDTDRVKFQGKPWSALANFQKRKFENFLFLNDSDSKLQKKIIYT